MKYLKRFNESINPYHNSEIEFDEFNILRVDAIPFTDREYNDIITIFGGESYTQFKKWPFLFTLSTYTNYNNTPLKTIQYISISYKSKKVCDICKLNDDWFIVQINFTNFYKCDTLEGVKEVVESSDIQIIRESEEYINTKIDTSMYVDLCKRSVEFNKYEIDILIALFDRPNFYFHKGTFDKYANTKTSSYIRIYQYTNNFCEIYKIEDDWYLLKIYNKGEFKCDTFDGLVEVITSHLSRLKSTKKYVNESEEYINTKIDYNVSRKVISDSIPFTDNDFEYIKKECELLDITVKKEKYINLDNNRITNDCIVLRIKYKLNNIKVFKLEDDWFIVFVSTKAYKCDGLEGLIEVIKREKWNI